MKKWIYNFIENVFGNVFGVVYGFIRDVAKHAGVSVSTVSRCLHNYYDVKKQTKKKVMQVIDELRYVPNFAA